MEEEEQQQIEEYLARRLSDNGEKFYQHFAMKEILYCYHPRIIFKTATIISAFANQFF